MLQTLTTGFRFFAECLRHSAKAKLHSAKPLPSTALDKEHTAKNWSAKPSLPSVFYRALGKGFAECPGDTRQRKATVTAPAPLTVALPSANPAGTRQRFFYFYLKNFFAECQPYRHSAKIFFIFFKKNSLPSAPWQALGKVWIFFLKNSLPSALLPALGKVWFFFKKILCRVPSGWLSAKFEIFLNFFAECPLAGTRQSLIFF